MWNQVQSEPPHQTLPANDKDLELAQLPDHQRLHHFMDKLVHLKAWQLGRLNDVETTSDMDTLTALQALTPILRHAEILLLAENDVREEPHEAKKNAEVARLKKLLYCKYTRSSSFIKRGGNKLTGEDMLPALSLLSANVRVRACVCVCMCSHNVLVTPTESMNP